MVGTATELNVFAKNIEVGKCSTGFHFLTKTAAARGSQCQITFYHARVLCEFEVVAFFAYKPPQT